MREQPVKRFGKRIMDRTLVPIVRYALSPVVEKLTTEFEKATVQLDEAGRRFASQLDEQSSRTSAQVAAQSLLYSDTAAKSRLRRSQPVLRKEIAELRAHIASQMPDNPCLRGFKVYAQTDEDGIIENLLDRLPGHSKTFIEIGCGNGLENNTHYLALKDYRGCWIDGSDDNITFIRSGLGGLEFQKLLVRKSFVGTENIGPLIGELCSFIGTNEPGFFSLDIDGNDFHVLAEALKYFRPLIICVEYTAKFPPPLKIVMRYNPSHVWAGDDYHGASLEAFCDELVEYKLVSCNLAGVNAFFVRRDQAGAFSEYPPRQLYQPFRENMIDLWAEHPPSLKWLRDRLS